MNSSRRELFFSIAAITFITLLTYGVLISQLGFYRDDWYLVWMAQTGDPQGMMSMFSGDRPFVGWLYVLDFWMLGVSPLAWNIYALFIKLLSAFALFWLLRSIWGNYKLETTFITLLFVVYPGFYQQANALTYKQMLIAYAAALFSLALTVHAATASKLIHKALFAFFAVLFGMFYIFIYESLVGLEVVRFMLLVYIFRRAIPSWMGNFRAAVLHILPHVLFALGFVYWRLFVFESTRNATKTENLFGHFLSLHGLIGFFTEFAKDLLEITLFAWFVPLYQFWNQVIYKEMGQAVLTAAAALLLCAGYFLLTKHLNAANDNAQENPPRDWLILGGLTILITTLPIVAAGRNALFGAQWDRYTYQSVLGAVLFTGGIIFYAVKGRLRWALFAFLILSGVMTQFFSANYYRAYWKLQREMWWQVAWRAPHIEDGTNLVVSLPGGFALAEEYEVWGPANMIYHPKNPSVVISGQILFSDIWLEFARNEQENRIVRGTIQVSRDYGRTIILAQPSQYSCLHVLDGRRFEQTVNERLDVQRVAQYSNVNFIRAAGEGILPPRESFGDEPNRGWCYYYQKMDLARQMEDWQTGANLADEAIALGLEPRDASEWLPALEAYVHNGNEKNAKRIANLIRIDSTTYRSLCAQYKLLREEPAEYDRAALFDALCAR